MLPTFCTLPKLQKGDKVAIVSPSFAAPGQWPHVYELGLQRLRDVFGLEPVAFPATAKVGAPFTERAADLVAAFEQQNIKAVIASLGGNEQVLYVKKLPTAPFAENPKPFFGFSDNTHFCHHLWMLGIPSYYGASLFTQFSMQGYMDDFTITYLKKALFEGGVVEVLPSKEFNDIGLNWEDPANLTKRRTYEPNEGWYWEGNAPAEGVSWGGCLESIDELLRHHRPLPSLEAAKNIVFFMETSEEMPTHENVHRVLRALGELGYLERFKGFLVGRPQSWDFSLPLSLEARQERREEQRKIVLESIRAYNQLAPVVQNMDFGHTNPQICLPMGRKIRIDTLAKRVFADFS